MKRLLLIIAFSPLLVLAQAVLPTSWNFTTPGISTPPTGWTAGLGTNGNLTYSGGGFSVGGDALSCRLDATGEFLQISFAERPGPLSYYIRGTGFGANPPFAGSFRVQESVDGNNWTDVRNFTSMTLTLTRFSETLAAASRHVRFFYADKQPGTNVALDSVMILQAPPSAVNLVIRQNTTTLISNNTFASGNTPRTIFTIQNTGTSSNLRIDSIVMSGANASDFTIGAFDSITPFGGAIDTFAVVFNPSSQGSRFGTIRVFTNDTERNPFIINLYAIGGNFATEPTSQSSSLTISNLRTHALDISFGKSLNAERYIVLRKPAATLTEVPVDGITYRRGDVIGGAQVAFVGTDTTTFRPTYILANTTYTFKVFAYNGPTGFENYNTTAAPSQTVTTPNGQPGNYYTGINPMVPTFISDLNNKIKIVDTVFYSNYAPVMVNGYLTRDTTNGRKAVTCVYSNEQYVYEDPFTWWTGQGGNPATLTREHTFAQSWMPTNTGNPWPNAPNGREYLEYNDLHNLFPAHQTNANARRSNNPFGEVVNPTYTAPTGFGTLGTDANGAIVYEPKEDQKGDLARALFYMLVRFNNINGITWRLPTSQDVNVLLQWHQQDPPSPLEIARNEYISTTQKNRNPFIDNPSWVSRINFNNMTYVADTTVKNITLTAPNGGEMWELERDYDITWTSQLVDTVVIQYQTIPNTPWILISNNTPAKAQKFVWTIPNIWNTSEARVRIFAKNDSSIVDLSATPFEIFRAYTPILNLREPTSENVLLSGSVFPIRWTSQDIQTLTFQYRVNSSSPWITIANNVSPPRGFIEDSALLWTVPDVSTLSAQIRVFSNIDPTEFDISGPFIISGTQPIQFIKILKPGISTQWNPSDGKLDSIKWISRQVDSVKIDLMTFDTIFNRSFGTTLASNGFFVVSDNMIQGIGGTVFNVKLTDTKSPFSTTSVSFSIMPFSSVYNLDNQSMISIYPNPSKGNVIINTTDASVIGEKLLITDITGRLVLEKTMEANTNIELQTSGVYFVKLKTEKGTLVKKLIIE